MSVAEGGEEEKKSWPDTKVGYKRLMEEDDSREDPTPSYFAMGYNMGFGHGKLLKCQSNPIDFANK